MTEEMDLSGNGEDSLIDDDVILLSDEFSLKKDKIPLLEEHKKRIEELFDIEIEYGLTAQEDEMQWVTVSGEDDNRAKARDYVRALCNPEDTMSVPYPPALHPLLTRFHVHEKLEKQSHAVIIFSDIGTAKIQGNDALSVTLALSAIEDVITKYESEQSNYTEGARSPAARQASLRLETELRRLSSENRTFEYDEDYSRWPDAVKRTILGWYIEESNPEIEPLENMSDLQEAAAEIESSSVTPKRPPAFRNDDELENGPAFAKYWDLGREKGYSDKDIESVLHNFGSQLKDHEFIQALKVHKTTSDSGADSTENPSQNPNGNGTPKQKKNSKKNSAARRKRNRSKETKKNKGGEGAYLELLTRDFEEEDHEMDIDGFKERSAQRIHLLQQALDLDEPVITDVRVNHKRDEDDGIAVDSTDWKVIPERNRGRRKMPYSKQQQNPQQNSQPSPSQNSDPRSAQEGFTNQQQQPNIGAYQPNYFSPNRQDFSPRGAQSRSYSPRGQQSPQGNRGGRGKSPSRLSPSRQPPRSYIHDRQSPSRRRSPARFNHVNPQAPQHSGDTVAANASGKPLRYIIIDGSNVAMSHSNGRCFSCRGIEICVNYFLKRGHKEITVFVPQWRTQIPKPGYAIEDQHILHELREKGHLVFTPARRVPGKNIVCYDDRFVIRLAIETEGIIISNDNYRDLWWENVDYRNIIEKSLLPYSFVGDFFMPPDDPLGRDGPHIDQFLTKTDEDDARVPHFQRGNASNAGLRQQGRQQNLRARGSQNFPQMSTSPRGRGNMILPPLQTGFGRGMPPGQNLFPPPQDYVNTGPPPQPHFQNQAFQNQGSQNKGFKQSQGHPKQGNQAFKNQGSSPPKQHPSRAWLRAQLLNVFPDNERQVDLVLQRNLKEINLNKLSSYILEMLQE